MGIGYYVLCVFVGIAIGSTWMYIHMIKQYNKEQQKKEIACFIGKIEELKKKGEIDLIKDYITVFSHTCLDFYAESFSTFSEYAIVANIINCYDNQNHPYHNTINSGVEAIVFAQNHCTNDLSKDDFQKKIYTRLCEIVGI